MVLLWKTGPGPNTEMCRPLRRIRRAASGRARRRPQRRARRAHPRGRRALLGGVGRGHRAPPSRRRSPVEPRSERAPVDDSRATRGTRRPGRRGKLGDHTRDALQQRAERGGLAVIQLTHVHDVTARLHDQRPEPERPDRLVDESVIRLEDHPARRFDPPRVDVAGQTAFHRQVAEKPRSSSRFASAYMLGESSTTAMSDTPWRVADATRHQPDLCVYPVLTPVVPGYVRSKLLLLM